MKAPVKAFKSAKAQRRIFVNHPEKEVAEMKCLEKDLLEEGFAKERDYRDNYSGSNVNRSEERLYGIYDALAEILEGAGKENVVAQGRVGATKSDLTVNYTGRVYDGVSSFLQVSPDLTYRESGDPIDVIRGIEVRSGSASLGKNIHNNVRSLAGEAQHFNHIVSTKAKVKGNYFTIVVFVDISDDVYEKVLASMLALYETGYKVAVVPYRDNGTDVEILLGSVPSPLQLMRVLRGI